MTIINYKKLQTTNSSHQPATATPGICLSLPLITFPDTTTEIPNILKNFLLRGSINAMNDKPDTFHWSDAVVTKPISNLPVPTGNYAFLKKTNDENYKTYCSAQTIQSECIFLDSLYTNYIEYIQRFKGGTENLYLSGSIFYNLVVQLIKLIFNVSDVRQTIAMVLATFEKEPRFDLITGTDTNTTNLIKSFCQVLHYYKLNKDFKYVVSKSFVLAMQFCLRCALDCHGLNSNDTFLNHIYHVQKCRESGQIYIPEDEAVTNPNVQILPDTNNLKTGAEEEMGQSIPSTQKRNSRHTNNSASKSKTSRRNNQT